MSKKFFNVAVLVSIIAFVCFGVLYISDSAYPDLLFRVLTLLFLVLICISLILLLLSWLSKIYEEIKSKNYLIAFVWLLAGIVLIVLELIK